MSNKSRYQEPRVGITVRLAKKDVMAKGDHFSQEQWEALKKLRPDITASSLVQLALAEYAKILPDILIQEQEKELERLRELKNYLYTTD
ncbi:hypothetical protein DTU56_09280 [Salmonella enterica subsp. enterica serovar Muenchen]|uniref:Uncharacterized protein n=2 Tax=root TaxID=1 RepID=A0A5U8XK77_SALMU|nr:hypothetical protein [Salmonella enterica subsp. enterica serovar Muenchen]